LVHTRWIWVDLLVSRSNGSEPKVHPELQGCVAPDLFYVDLCFFVDSAHGLGLQAQKRYSHPLLFTSLLYLHPPPVYDFN
jgi:hypothetical protein